MNEAAVAGQEPTGRREECSVGRTKVRTPHLPAQDVQLVTQDRDLDLLGGDGRTYATASTDQPAEHEIEDGPDHGAKMVPIRCPPRRIGLLAPFTLIPVRLARFQKASPRSTT